MVKYIIIHNKHEGCYDYKVYEDEVSRLRLTSITINPPKIFLFDDKFQAQEFFEEYINDVDVVDIKCRNGDEIEHVDYCTCGIIELDDDENPILFYNKRNQIFLMEHGPQVFLPPQDIKNDIGNFNLTNRLIRKCRTLGKEQRKKYIELGRMCQECDVSDDSDNEKEKEKTNEGINTVIKEDVITPESDKKTKTKVKPKVSRVKPKTTNKETTEISNINNTQNMNNSESTNNSESVEKNEDNNKPKEKKTVKKRTTSKKDNVDNTPTN